MSNVVGYILKFGGELPFPNFLPCKLLFVSNIQLRLQWIMEDPQPKVGLKCSSPHWTPHTCPQPFCGSPFI